MVNKVIEALSAWKEENDCMFPWEGPKPQRVLRLPLKVILIDKTDASAFITVEDLMRAFKREECGTPPEEWK